MQLITLSKARERLWDYADAKVPFASATQTQKDTVDWRINQVCERFFDSGKWKGMLRRITVDVHDGYITLPRELATILGIKLIRSNGCCCHSIIYSRFHEFAHGIACCSTGTYPISETAQTFITPDAGFKLRVKSTVSESKTITFIGGWDTDDEEYFDSVSLTIVNGSATTTREWNVMPPTGGIQKQVTTVPCELYSVDSDGNEELIAVYGPNEEVPAYKRYKIPEWTDDFNSALVFGKLGFIEAVADSDIIIPSHWGALKMGLKALQSEDTEEDDSADKDWERAFNLLNANLTESEGDSEFPMFRVAPEFGAGSIPNLV